MAFNIDLPPCPPDTTPVTFNRNEGQDFFQFTTSDHCTRVLHALAGKKDIINENGIIRSLIFIGISINVKITY